MQVATVGTHVYDNIRDHVLFFLIDHLPRYKHVENEMVFYVAWNKYRKSFAEYELRDSLSRQGVSVRGGSSTDALLNRLVRAHIWVRREQPPLLEYLEETRILTSRSKAKTVRLRQAEFRVLAMLMVWGNGGMTHAYLPWRLYQENITLPIHQEKYVAVENLLTHTEDTEEV